MFGQKKAAQAVNEFNQYLKPVSLWSDAWKRLRRNKMAVISLWVVLFYLVISLSAPLLENMGLIYDYTEQHLEHRSLGPSLKPSGELVLDRVEARIAQLEAAIGASAEKTLGTVYDFFAPATGESGNQGAGFGAFDTDQGPLLQELTIAKAELAKTQTEISSNPIHKRVYVFGTDDLGRDLLARVINGGRISILIGLVGMITAVFIGIVVGAISGYLGGWIDNLLMRFVDIMYGLPYMLLVIIIMSIIGDAARGSFVILFLAIAMVSWLTIARVVRGQIISLKNAEFVEAARSMGASVPRIIFRHLIPNTLGVIIVYSTLLIPSFIMNESFLSYLGLGVSAPNASWGTLVNEGVRGMQLNPHQLLAPAISMTLFLFCMNFLGDGLRDALDPQSKNRG